ncbi:MAG: hypothetical protein LBU17_11355, partial [Treponema sp.]|nr:hypothetical protein [Treponema sp.]
MPENKSRRFVVSFGKVIFSNKKFKFNRGSVELKTKDVHAYREYIAFFPRLGMVLPLVLLGGGGGGG